MGMKDITSAAKTIIEAEIASSVGALATVKKVFQGGGFPPQAISPSICIGADVEERQHKRAAGTDPASFGEQYKWFICIIVTAGDLEESYENACDIWEELKPIVDENYQWNNLVHDTNYNGSIEYGAGVMIGDRSGLTYNIVVPLVSNIRWGAEG